MIVGGSGALGSFLVKELLNENNLIVISRKKNFVKKNVKNINYYRCNLLDQKNTKNVLDRIKVKFTRIDALIFVSAVHGKIAPFYKINMKKYKEIFQINFFSFIEITTRLLNNLKKSQNASIIVFSGGGATFQRPFFSGYASSKIALVKLVETMAGELVNSKINVNAIAPGALSSKLFRQAQNFEKKKNVKFVEKIKILNLINFLLKKENKNINGKLLSAQWDNMANLKKVIKNKEIYTLRRISK